MRTPDPTLRTMKRVKTRLTRYLMFKSRGVKLTLLPYWVCNMRVKATEISNKPLRLYMYIFFRKLEQLKESPRGMNHRDNHFWCETFFFFYDWNSSIHQLCRLVPCSKRLVKRDWLTQKEPGSKLIMFFCYVSQPSPRSVKYSTFTKFQSPVRKFFV